MDKIIKDLLDRWHDRNVYFPENVTIGILLRDGLSTHLDIHAILNQWYWDIRCPETVKKHLDRMVSEGKIRSERGKNFTYYGVLKND
jgi:hypothetical protein